MAKTRQIMNEIGAKPQAFFSVEDEHKSKLSAGMCKVCARCELDINKKVMKLSELG